MLRQSIWLVVMLCGLAGAQEPDLKWVDAFAARAASQQPTRQVLENDLQAAKLQLASAKAAKVGRAARGAKHEMMFRPAYWIKHGGFPTKEDKQAAIEKDEELVKIREGYLSRHGTNQFVELEKQLKVGVAGTPWRDEIKVSQIIDKRNAIVSMIRAERSYSSVGGIPQASNKAVKQDFWIEADTSSWADGGTIEFKEPLVFTGNKTYSTADGSSRTLLFARTWNEAELKRFKEWKPQKSKSN